MSIAHQDTDAHSPIGLDRLRFGGDQAAPEQTPEPDVTSIYGPASTPDPDRLRAALELAREALPLQQATELREIKSDAELQAEIAQARQHRDDLRKQADLDHQVEIKLRNEQREHRKSEQHAALNHEAAMAKAEREHQQAAAEAEAERRRLRDPLHELVRARLARRWLPKLAMVPSVVAAIVSAINLGLQGERVIEQPVFGAVLGAGLDAVFTIGLVAIALGRMAGAATVTSDDDRSNKRWYLGGEIGLGFALGAASVGAHHLPSANGAPHTAELGWWFLLLPLAFGFSTIFAPKLQEDTTRRFIFAAREAELVRDYGSMDADQVRVLRLARWLAEQERSDNPIGGERTEQGLPSASALDKRIREHFGKSSKGQARRVIETYAILSGLVE